MFIIFERLYPDQASVLLRQLLDRDHTALREAYQFYGLDYQHIHALTTPRRKNQKSSENSLYYTVSKEVTELPKPKIKNLNKSLGGSPRETSRNNIGILNQTANRNVNTKKRLSKMFQDFNDSK